MKKNITMTNTTPISRVRFARPLTASRSLICGVGGAFRRANLSSAGFGELGGLGADLWHSRVVTARSFYAPTHKTNAVKDVAFIRSWSPPV